MAGEGARDESLIGDERLKVSMFIPVLYRPADYAAEGEIQ